MFSCINLCLNSCTYVFLYTTIKNGSYLCCVTCHNMSCSCFISRHILHFVSWNSCLTQIYDMDKWIVTCVWYHDNNYFLMKNIWSLMYTIYENNANRGLWPRICKFVFSYATVKTNRIPVVLRVMCRVRALYLDTIYILCRVNSRLTRIHDMDTWIVKSIWYYDNNYFFMQNIWSLMCNM